MNLNQVTLPTSDLERAIEFYEKLGLHLIVKSIPRYARFECPVGDSTFSLHYMDPIHLSPGISIYFEVDNLDREVKALKEKGIVFDEDPEDKNWLWREAHLSDPDGNQIILFHAGENRKNPPWRLN